MSIRTLVALCFCASLSSAFAADGQTSPAAEKPVATTAKAEAKKVDVKQIKKECHEANKEPAAYRACVKEKKKAATL